MASSRSNSVSDSGGYSPFPSPPSASPPPSWTTSSHASSEQHEITGQPPAGGCPVVERAPIRRRSTAARSFVNRSPEDLASTMTSQEVINLGAKYGIPRGMLLSPPVPDDRVTSSRPGRVALYKAFFQAGLRLPFHPFVLNLLDRYSLTPAQLVPNSFRSVIGFLVLCHLNRIEASISLFRCFYTLRRQGGWWAFIPRPTRTLKLCLPSSIKNWKSKFFFVNVEGVSGVWGIPSTDANRNSSVLPRDQGALDRLLSASVPRCNQLLAEDNLRLAGVIPRGGE